MVLYLAALRKASLPGTSSTAARISRFVQPSRSLATTRQGVAAGYLADLALPERVFLLMPYQHAEDLPAQQEGMRFFENMAAAARGSTLRVETVACGRFFTGTAFAVAPGHFLTNAHVVAGSERLWLSFDGSLDRLPGVTVINGGSVGAGGTGNLTESTDYGLARLIYTTEPNFQPLAADLITIDPGDGSSTAKRQRLESET